MANISPGVYTKIIDLSTYVQAVPSTTGFICALTEKGRDNELIFVGSRSELISEWGEPNIATYGKNYGQGLYLAYNFLGESGSLYFMRCLPDNAAYANIRIDTSLDSTATDASVSITYVDSVNTITELISSNATVGDTKPLCMLYPIGRGVYYNALGIRITSQANPMLAGIYVMDIYERQSDGDDVIIESFDVSFEPTQLDDAGDSIFIVDVLEKYSTVLRAEMEVASGDWTDGYNLAIRTYDKSIGDVTAVDTTGVATITDSKQDFSDWQTSPQTGNASYSITVYDAKGNKLTGWLGASAGVDDVTINVFNGRDLSTATQSWIGNTSLFDFNNEITYSVKQSFADISTAFASATPVPLKKGSDGELFDASGDLNLSPINVPANLLANGYAGTIDDSVLDSENIYFNMVFDAGYSTTVKDQISTMVQTRKDCISILDNGDNATFNIAITSRTDTHTYNNYYTAMHEPYNKINDIFTGREIWVSPVYHMSYLLPRNDSVGEQWFAAAGFTRGIIDTIKEMRFSPTLGQRDQMYLKQLNPVVKFNPGYTLWSQLTSQSKPSALQDINIVRLVLYTKRALEQFARYFVFEQNDAVTWGQVSKGVTEFLEDIKRRRGLDSFTVEVGATDYERKRKTFHVNVTLEPTRVVEKIELNFFIK